MSGNPNYRTAADSGEPSSNWHWSLTVLIVGIVVGAIASLGLRKFVVLSLTSYWLIVVGIGLLGAAIQYSRFKKKKYLSNRGGVGLLFYFLYNIFGIGFLGMTFVLLGSIFVPISDVNTTEIKIIGEDPEYLVSGRGVTPVLLENDAFANDPVYRGLPYMARSWWKGANYSIMGFDTYTGLFGFEVKAGRYLRVDKDNFPEHLLERKEEILSEAKPYYF